MLVGYTRVSTDEQNMDRQIDQLMDAGVDVRMIYQEKILMFLYPHKTSQNHGQMKNCIPNII